MQKLTKKWPKSKLPMDPSYQKSAKDLFSAGVATAYK